MSNEVTLNANAVTAQASVATAAVVVDGVPRAPDSVSWSSSDENVAVISAVNPDRSATVQAVRDPSGPSTRTCTVTCAASAGGFSGTGNGVATVITTNDGVSVTIDFSPPTP